MMNIAFALHDSCRDPSKLTEEQKLVRALFADIRLMSYGFVDVNDACVCHSSSHLTHAIE